jgi:hypothetical protein
MIKIQAPNPTPSEYKDNFTLFLAGSIEMGTAEHWQNRVIETLKDCKRLTIYNPRRADWDSSWVQSIDNPQFREQVEWELDHLQRANLAIFYFDPSTKSPITLMELGMMSNPWSPLTIVVCPKGFWRRGNVEIFCNREGIEFFETLEDAIEKIKEIMG